MAVFDGSYWSDDVRNPWGRMLFALAIGTALLGGVLALVAFLMARLRLGTGEEGAAAVSNAVAEIVLYLAVAAPVALFGLTVLWALRLRGPLPWALMGALIGAAMGTVYGTIELGRWPLPLLAGFGMLGWGLFLVMRWLAGVKDG